jgi:ABC-2 type transport system ATP-binding protein
MGRVVLSASAVKKSYGAVQALSGVDLHVDRGEFVVLLGLNGAGKSTLIQLLTGLFSPDFGALSVFGFDLRRNPTAALAQIGVVFQQPTVDLELSVRANLLFHTDLHGMSRREARPKVAAALERFGLAARAGDSVRALSGGNRRRVELARALLHSPRLLLMDEATVGLDPASRRDILDHIHRLRSEQGLAVLWTTHLVDEAERADRIVVLHQGAVLHDGTAQSLMERERAAAIGPAFLSATARRVASDGSD